MRSGAKGFARPKRWLCASFVVAALVLSTQASAQAVESSGDPSAKSEITQQDIAAALEVVRKDPNLRTEGKMRTLRWVEGDSPPKKTRQAGWMKWLAEFFGWLAQNARYLFWGVLVVLAVMLVVYLARLARVWRLPARARALDVPSFVRDLDIRPESLPDDIGAAARQLWDAGDHRAALSLLYRGLLSRLVHVHGVPIKDSTTEGDCLALAGRHLFDEGRKQYVAKLIRVWQRAVYGGEPVASELLYELCDEFGRALNEPEAQPASGAQISQGMPS